MKKERENRERKKKIEERCTSGVQQLLLARRFDALGWKEVEKG